MCFTIQSLCGMEITSINNDQSRCIEISTTTGKFCVTILTDSGDHSWFYLNYKLGQFYGICTDIGISETITYDIDDCNVLINYYDNDIFVHPI